MWSTFESDLCIEGPESGMDCSWKYYVLGVITVEQATEVLGVDDNLM